jgi:uncharacterized protein YjiS (DUF1127 family)
MSNTQNFSRIDYRSMSPEQQFALMQQIIREAHAQRAQLLGEMIGNLVVWSWKRLAAVAGAFVRWWQAYAVRRQRLHAKAALHALNDRELRDIGVSRSEIDWVIDNGRDRPARTIRPVALPKPVSARPGITREPAHGGTGERRAA